MHGDEAHHPEMIATGKQVAQSAAQVVPEHRTGRDEREDAGDDQDTATVTRLVLLDTAAQELRAHDSPDVLEEGIRALRRHPSALQSLLNQTRELSELRWIALGEHINQ